jgi:CMP-N,N'-diacetyllegionaminic acid synthase
MDTQNKDEQFAQQKVVAVIPARGGSKGIPRKNLIPVLGQPLIYWSIKTALESDRIDRVIVSTDDPEIAEVAQHCGADVPFLRPKKFAEDSSLDIDVFKHLIDWYEDSRINLPSCFVHLRPTGPARCLQDINQAVSFFLENDDLDSLRSVCLAEQTPYKMWLIEGSKLVSVAKDPGISEFHSQPRQKLPKVFWQNGYVDIIKPSTISSLNSMVGSNSFPFICSSKVKDIDYLSDVPQVEKSLEEIINGNLMSLIGDIDEVHSV